ncbi:MAG: glycosyltransferase family 4 protein [Candidatus Hydrogenedentes bacterium]|nr:glycosyltransferase family 4 protein [Candidatus Hydrogenedentota bacterium]
MSVGIHVVAVPRRFVREDWGGIETYVLETGRRIQAAGNQFEVVCPAVLSSRNEEEIGGVRVKRLGYFYPYWNLGSEARLKLDKVGGNLFSFSLMHTLMQIPNIDLFHLHTGKRLGGIVRTVSKWRRIPYVITLHGGIYDLPAEEESALMAPADNAFEWGKILGWCVGSRRVLDDAAALFCVGRQEQRLAQERFPGKRIEYLPNGVDVEYFARGDGQRFRQAHGIPESARLLLTVARIAPQKNQLFLVKALPDLRRSDPSIHIAFVGSVNNEDYWNNLTRCARENGLEDAVTVVPGLTPEDPMLVDAYHAADVFVLPSVHEPFGIVVLEAWAAGCPVIASRVGGIPDFVKDGTNGLLFEADDIVDFLRAYGSLTTERALALAASGRETVERYSWDNVTNGLLNIYQAVIADSVPERGKRRSPESP